MTRAATPRRGRRFPHSLLPVALAALTFVFAATAIASPRPGSRDEQLLARPIAPAPGEKLQESEVIFTFERGRAASESRVVLLPREFDPTGWTSIPSLEGLVVHDASKGVITLAETGVSLTQPTTWWWSVGSRDAATGAWHFSPARAFTATPRFTNRVAPSPYLMRGVVGTMSADELKQQRQDAFHEMSPISANAAKATGLTATAAASPDVPHIRLGAGFDFVPTRGLPDVPAELSMSRVPADATPGAIQSWLVQFTEAPDASDLKKIAAAGGAVFAYIPDQAYLVRGTADARERLAHQSSTAWTGDWEPAYKLSPRADRASSAASTFEALLFPDADVEATKLALTALGANVMLSSDNGVNKLVRFSLRGDQLAAAAGLSNVVWIEPFVMPLLHNDLAQWVVQTGVSNSRRVWDMGIKGEGQVVNTTDSGIHMAHDQFRDPAVPVTDFGDYPTHRKVIAYKRGSTDPNIEFDDHAGASYHGTHTAGTIAGSDDPVGGVSTRDGMAKNAKIYFMDISGTALANGVSPPADLNDLFLPPYLGNAGGAARLSSNSWGSAVNGAYTLNSFEVDQFMWSHPDFYIAFSTGNSGTVGSVGSPATSKDCAGMGGIKNGTSENTIYSLTSKGPCADGRRKPTFASVATGQTTGGLISANGATTNGYVGLSGTSMASPSGTGAVALVRQYLTEGWYPTGAKVPANGFSPSAALLKAIAINSADPITGSPTPDNLAGWGRINIDNALYFAGDAKKLLLEDFTAGLGQGQSIEYQVNVVDGTVPLEVSLCWTDFPGSPAASVQLVNNLNLTVTKGASVWKGNVYSGSQSATGGTYDALNVEESVLLSAPATGVYTVRIDAPTVPVGPQPFGLAITGGVGNGAGTLALDRSEYGSSSTVNLQVIDTNASGPLTVHLSSPTDPTGEDATLNGGNGVFTGSLALTPALTSTSDGLLSVSNGDLITASYSDASPVASMAATATVNFSAPVITNVRATSLGASGTLVTWTTDRNSTSRVYYGTTGALELGSVDSTGYVTSHQVFLPNITPGQTYPYDVESVSLSGSSTRDDKGGAHYRFTGKPSGDVALIMSDPNFGRQFAWTNALANNSYDYDLVTGTLASSPVVGDLNSGLRSYRAVIFQCGPDDYPPVSDVQRTAIDSYMAGGGRLWILGHDLGWGMADPTSPGYSGARAAWLSSALHANFLADPATWANEFGIASDPISGGFSVSPVPYTPFGSGQAGDEISASPGAGTSSFVWRDDDATPDNNVLRWTDGVNDGSPGTAVWGGQPSRLVSEFLEFTAMAPPFASPSATRDTVLNRTLQWLFGRQRPTVALSAPNGGETITSSPANITWTETVGPGMNVASRKIEYSIDGGDSWTTITTGAGTSPYGWDLSGIPNTTHARVRIKLVDDGAPSLAMTDASVADFTINLAGNDANGPVVVPGSIASSPNPIVRGNNITLTATVTDANSGGAAVDQAEWSFGPTPAAAGTGTAMTGAFGSTSVNVSLSIVTNGFTLGTQRLWVRGHDAAGNWGPASSLSVLVNGTGTTGVDGGGIPAVAFLGQSAPNPAVGPTTIAFGLARGGAIALDVFDAQGRLVKSLAKGAYAAGYHHARWDGRDASGARVGAGLYFYRLVSPEGRFEKRVAMLQ